jgi:SAM-dependent methyltransferase
MSNSDIAVLCPKCRAKIGTISEDFKTEIKCPACSFKANTLHGVPILYQTENLDELDQLQEASSLPIQNSDDLKIPFVQEALSSNEWVLELGAGIDVCANPKLIKTDAFLYSKDLHCLADAHSLPFEDNTFGFIYSLAVFEHLHSPWIAAKEIFRVLKPGGKVFVLTAFTQHMHGYPNHYFNMTLSGLKHIFKNFEIESLRPSKWSSLNEIMYIMMDYISLIKQTSSHMLSNDEMNMLDSSFKQICSINSKVDTFVHENADFSHDQNWAKIAPAIDIIARKPN